jgi:hypothetical protein
MLDVDVERGQHDDLRRGGAAPQRLGGGEPVHSGHADVHEHDVWMVLPDQPDCLGAVSRLGDHPQVGGNAEHPAESEADDGIVVHDDDGHLGYGSYIPTRQPPASVGPCSIPRPMSAARSACGVPEVGLSL